MEKSTTPSKRPLTPFYLYSRKRISEEKEKGKDVTLDDLGKEWKSLTEYQQKLYLQEYQRIKKGTLKVEEFTSGRFQSELNQYKINEPVCNGLAHLAVNFIIKSIA